jgi:hypothetical protein
MKGSKVAAMTIIGIMTILAFFPMASSAQEAGAVANVGTNTSIVTVPAYNNPVLVAKSCEPSMIYNSSMGWIDEWFTGGTTYGGTGGYIDLYYTHTTNANYTTHTTPLRVMQNIRFPYIVTYDGIFYCFAHNSSAIVGNLYMWTSHDKVTWTIANGGQAVLHNSASGSSLRYWMANPAVFLLNGMWYMWIECGDSTAVGGTWQNFVLAYSYSAFSSSLNFTTNMTTSYVIGGGVGAPYVQYVADRNAVLIVYHQLTDPYLAQETTATASLSSNLALPSSYVKSGTFVVGIITQVTADWTWAITPTSIEFQIFHDQPTVEDIYQGSIALTLDQFYDALGGIDYTDYSVIPDSTYQLLYLIPFFLTLGILMIPVMFVVKQTKEKRPLRVEEVLRMFITIVLGMALVGITYVMI